MNDVTHASIRKLLWGTYNFISASQDAEEDKDSSDYELMTSLKVYLEAAIEEIGDDRGIQRQA